MTDFPEILPDRDPTPPEDYDFDVDAELHRLADRVRRLDLANAELTGCLESIELSLRNGALSFEARGGVWTLIRDLLARHAKP